MFRLQSFIAVCAPLVLLGRAAAVPASPGLLREAVDNWVGERDHWAFTQRATEYQRSGTHERLERYDPSRPRGERWRLITVDGKQPTPAEWQKWAKRKLKPHGRRLSLQVEDFFDFDSARIVAQTPALIEYDIPLRRDKNWLFPVSKVDVRVIIDKRTHALEHLTARVREPFRVLLGIARVTGGALNFDFLNLNGGNADPNNAKPKGTAHVSVSRLGERVDFTWSDFKRVEPNPSSADDRDESYARYFAGAANQ